MKVLHVLTLVSSRGEYGGPQAVAENLAAALSELGHDVTILAGRRPDDALAAQALSAKVVAVPVRRVVPIGSVSSLLGARMMWRIVRHVGDSDLVHIHFARDLVSIATAVVCLVRGRPYVVQTHGMVRRDRRRFVRVLDRLMVTPLVRCASQRLVLTDVERAELAEVGVLGSTLLLPNGSPTSSGARADGRSREALFLARIHPRKRVMDFARAASESKDARITYAVVGPDGGQLGELMAYMAEAPDTALTYEGALPPAAVGHRLSAAGVFVLPSEQEPFPMAVVEALAAGLPCVVTESCAIALMLQSHGAAIVVPDGRPALIEGAVREVLGDPDQWQRMSQAALRVSAGELDLAHIAQTLDGAYVSALRARQR